MSQPTPQQIVDSFRALSNQIQLWRLQADGIAKVTEKAVEACPEMKVLFSEIKELSDSSSDCAEALDKFRASITRVADKIEMMLCKDGE